MEIVKGKRTKRLRPHYGGDVTCFTSLSPEQEFSDDKSLSTEEDEDMAKCLILLAQGFYPKKENAKEKEGYSKSENIVNKKRLVEIDSVATTKTCNDLYECKACNRKFPSFQALGGHRTSHKKPVADRKEEKQVKGEEVKGQLSHSTPPLKFIKASKVHECSICGSEFSSGQALGGHMRRHRVAPVVKTASESEEEISDHRTMNILSFDLNLPAPIEDDQDQLVESAFGFKPKNHMVFSAQALVGCNY